MTVESKPTPARREPAVAPAGAEVLMSKAQVCAALGISLPNFNRMVSAGQFPAPDLHLGRFPRWRIPTYNAYVAACAARER
jgi:predicted DNA-binding transcriptional regulator AlpA